AVGSDGPTRYTSAGREAPGEAVRPAAQPEASSPERGGAARGAAHRLDQPSEGLAPRNGRPTASATEREPNERRSRLTRSRWSR
ncbi:hypothetical protein, partial [Halorubrum persicum]|uniref:hypothetical protein n=1 Tax=Halorubrum persicum TaxID=1383844 RepID=UPI001C5568CF